MNEMFRKFSAKVSAIVGSAGAFIVAITAIAVWAITGPIVNFSDTWQLLINTGTTIITFLIVFIIQNTQNRDAKAMRLQLDEIITSMKNASNQYLDLDNMSDEELDKLERHFQNMNQKLASHRKKKSNRS